MRYMGHANINVLIRPDIQTENTSPSATTVPPGAYGRDNEEVLRLKTGMSLKAIFNKIVAHSSPRPSPSPQASPAWALLRRAGSINVSSSPHTLASPRLRRPSMEDVGYTSHILVSLPIPEDIAKAVCELWTHRIAASHSWWLADTIDLDSPNEEALFAVVRLALIDRVRQAQLRPADDKPVCESRQVVLFSGDNTNMSVQKAVVAARSLTQGDRTRVKLLDQILQRRVLSPDYAVRSEEIPRGDSLEMWQSATAAILRHVAGADGALRNSDLIDALRLAWQQSYILQG